ncbi:mRNA splicing protein [Dimargaris xerosporica]|nr:mRNA splicing protein [Dimargaris xerosporica]
MSSLTGANSTGKLSREEYRRQKDLEAARKAGTAPAEVDEEGRDINPHIPHYMVNAPWYVATGAPSLKHQRILPTFTGKHSDADKGKVGSERLNQWYARGHKQGPAATKYRKGACENCGAKTHKARDCLERPRKQGARWTGQDIKPDEVIAEVNLDFESKRDRWNGYDPKDHRKIIDEWELIEQERKKRKAEELDRALREGSQNDGDKATTEKLKRAAIGDDSDDSDADDDRYAEQADMPGQKVNTKTRITVRNLRIREDTAKYLRNLDPNSAHYDPKTRSMRDNPYKGQEASAVPFAGDNFVRYSGEASDMANLQLFAWEANERGNSSVHLQANPTQGELLHREFKAKKETLKKDIKSSILDKYGGEEHLQAPPKELLLAQTENYVEYSRTGKVIHGQERAVNRSKYEEDVFPNNHSSVWGSYWEDGKWGYKCCRATLRNAYCTAQA